MSSKASWSPEHAGAKCDECPLKHKRTGQPVRPEIKAGTHILFVGQEPGPAEAAKGKPFIGGAGQELDRLLAKIGLQRSDVSIDNAIACCPADGHGKPLKGGLTSLIAQIKTKNAYALRTWRVRAKAAVAEAKVVHKDWWKKGKDETKEACHARREAYIKGIIGEPAITKSPVTCCAPRLARNVSRYSQIIPLGGLATKCITGKEEGINALRGDTITLPDGKRVVPTFNQAALLREARHLRWVVERDLSKALRFFRGELQWDREAVDARIVYNPSLDRLEEILFGPQSTDVDRWTYDWETTKGDPLAVTPKCISIGWRDRWTKVWSACVLIHRDAATLQVLDHVILPDGSVRPAGETYWQAATKLLVERWQHDDEDGRAVWYGQNAGNFDRMVSECHLGYAPLKLVDLLLLHRASFPQLRHNLALIGTTLTDIGAWKVDEAGDAMALSDDNFSLWHYCALDSIVTGMCVDALLDGDYLRDVPSLLRSDYFRPMPCAALGE